VKEPSEVGTTGLLWLFVSYGYVLYYASNLISEGSDLLMLVPSMAGLVGGVVLPLLGAVPDGAIMLFSGLGDIQQAQETLSVGVGALAGSTIMLLTVPWALSVYGGRVDIDPATGTPDYLGKPKLTPNLSWRHTLTTTGVSISDQVKNGAIVMVITTIPYFLIQVPASFIHGAQEDKVEGEHWWALGGFVVCILGFLSYMYLQLQISRQGEDRTKRVAVMKKMLEKGLISLSGALNASIKSHEDMLAYNAASEYQAIDDNSTRSITSNSVRRTPPPGVAEYLKEVLADAFMFYDTDRNGYLDKMEVKTIFKDFHESLDETDMDYLFESFDTDHSGNISFDEFISLCYTLIVTRDRFQKRKGASTRADVRETEFVNSVWNPDTEEEEDIPEDFTDMTPEDQQSAIKLRAFTMLAIGTFLVVLFSDPMVDVFQEIANRLGLSAFYVSFVLAPIASNASEVIASQFYALKKTRKTITVSLTALEGAASMNNTFCLSIFMGLIFFRGLAWQYTAETIAIVAVEFIMAMMVQTKTMTMLHGLFVLSIFPLSLVLVAVLEAIGLD
jgi:Ca2+/Na+ antiporter